MNSQVICDSKIKKGMPVSFDGYCKVTGKPIGVAFNGKDFLGIAIYDVTEKLSTRYDQASVGGFLPVAMTGCTVRLELDADIGDYIQPTVEGWFTTKYKTLASVGRVIYRNKRETTCVVKVL